MHIFIILLFCKFRLQTSASRSWLDPNPLKLGALKWIWYIPDSLHFLWRVCAQLDRRVPHSAQAQIFLPSPCHWEIPVCPCWCGIRRLQSFSFQIVQKQLETAITVLQFKFSCTAHSTESESKARDGHGTGFTERTCISGVSCSHTLNLHLPPAEGTGKLQI